MGIAEEWDIPKGPTLAGVSTYLQLVWAAQDSSPRGEGALRALVERYYQPIRRTLDKSRVPADHLDDVAHAFCARLCEGDIVKRYDRGMGSFRTYIEKCLKYFFIDWLRRENLRHALPLDDCDVEAVGSDPSAPFPREYALGILADARKATGERLEGDKRAWKALRVYYLERDLEGPTSVEGFADKYEITVDEFRGALIRGRKAFKAEVENLLAPGVGDGDQLNEELLWFFRMLEQIV